MSSIRVPSRPCQRTATRRGSDAGVTVHALVGDVQTSTGKALELGVGLIPRELRSNHRVVTEVRSHTPNGSGCFSMTSEVDMLRASAPSSPGARVEGPRPSAR